MLHFLDRATRVFLLLWLAVGGRIDPAVSQPAAPSRSLTVVSWNVENLFDPWNDPDNEWDERYTPQGQARWTEARYRRKLANLAQVIQALQPDILCLQEVENAGVLRDLGAILQRDHNLDLPHILHRGGEDFRGMDVAIMTRIPAVETNWFRPYPGRRDILEAVFEPAGRRVTVLNHHWKSRFGDAEDNRRLRNIEAAATRARLDIRLGENPHAAIVVAGDFNDDIEDPPLVQVGRFWLDRAAVRADPEQRALYNLSAELAPEDRFTFYFHGGERWNSFDAIIVSRGMLPEAAPGAPWRIRPASYAVVRPLFMQDRHGRPLAFRRVRNPRGRWVYQYGYSDHYPVRVEIW